MLTGPVIKIFKPGVRNFQRNSGIGGWQRWTLLTVVIGRTSWRWGASAVKPIRALAPNKTLWVGATVPTTSVLERLKSSVSGGLFRLCVSLSQANCLWFDVWKRFLRWDGSDKAVESKLRTSFCERGGVQTDSTGLHQIWQPKCLESWLARLDMFVTETWVSTRQETH